MVAAEIWGIIALFFLIIELFTSGFSVFCLSVGAAASALVALLFDATLTWQIITFALVSTFFFILVRPLILKIFFKTGKETKTNADSLINKEAIVEETIDNNINKGRVKIDGDSWRAISENNETIEKDMKVIIIARDSIILTVKKL